MLYISQFVGLSNIRYSIIYVKNFVSLSTIWRFEMSMSAGIWYLVNTYCAKLDTRCMLIQDVYKIHWVIITFGIVDWVSITRCSTIHDDKASAIHAIVETTHCSGGGIQPHDGAYNWKQLNHASIESNSGALLETV